MSDISLEARITQLEKKVRRMHTFHLCMGLALLLAISLFGLAQSYQGRAFGKLLEAQLQTNQAMLDRSVSGMHADGNGSHETARGAEVGRELTYVEH